MTLPTTADIVVICGGVMGTSTLYNLAACGQNNVILLEKNEFFLARFEESRQIQEYNVV